MNLIGWSPEKEPMNARETPALSEAPHLSRLPKVTEPEKKNIRKQVLIFFFLMYKNNTQKSFPL